MTYNFPCGGYADIDENGTGGGACCSNKLCEFCIDQIEYIRKQKGSSGETVKKVFMNNWIPVSERLPEKDGRYLVVEDHPYYKWVGVNSLHNGGFDNGITHWQELPGLPV